MTQTCLIPEIVCVLDPSARRMVYHHQAGVEKKNQIQRLPNLRRILHRLSQLIE